MLHTCKYGQCLLWPIQIMSMLRSSAQWQKAELRLVQVGRAGRFGTKGLAITFVASEDDSKVPTACLGATCRLGLCSKTCSGAQGGKRCSSVCWADWISLTAYALAGAQPGARTI